MLARRLWPLRARALAEWPAVVTNAGDAVASQQGLPGSVAGQRGMAVMASGLHPAVKGAGGRSSVSGLTVTVFGATGFLGRYVVQQLARVGSQVVVPYRGIDDEYRHLKPMGDLGQIVPIHYDIRNDALLAAALARSNVVINLLGRDHETRNFRFQDINVDFPTRLAQACAAHGGIQRFVHLSCLNASPESPSAQLRTKAAGEAAVRAILPEAVIMRPAPMFGTEDRLLKHIASLVKKMPAVPLIGGGATKVQPVSVLDVAAAVLTAVRDDGAAAGQTFTLGGPDVFTYKQVFQLVFDTIREAPSTVDLPFPLAKLLALPREWLLPRLPTPVPSPPMFTADYIHRLEQDQVVPPNCPSFPELGLTPRRMAGINIEYLFSYRAGGPDKGTTLGEATDPTTASGI
ncbi:NAD(P)-binding Rossmann-fold superfamily protein [Klebsormidium nitens]|uniref:NAD(P)-binding Rossmann-fold superfamily protein n=1 Tax=Klebsormidium nitens TaxID=105231 RepID=A0A1Y1IUJ2_KLENI|nr:NAD(P)-binding Rossmann-fold superfamily protein [Klebsormidium nitens]|eukprot:GAQ92347.1 NAD(P)-binding Rossmann-fold superfamily protein [Klebsormidium nitens]